MAEAAALRGAAWIADIPRYWAQHAPEALALCEDDWPVSFAVLVRRLEAAAHPLRDAGADAGDRVMIVGENCAALIEAFFGVSALGAWPVVVNARLAPYKRPPRSG